MTLNALALALVAEHGERQGDTAFVTQLETWIKDDLIKISLNAKFKSLFKDLTIITVVNQPGYDLPADFKNFKYLRVPDGDHDIEYLSPRKLAKFNFDLEQKGSPPRFAWIVNSGVVGGVFKYKVRFHPIPNVILNVDAPYHFYPSGLVSASDIPVNDELLLLLKSRLNMRIHRLDLDWDSFNSHRAEYVEDMRNIIKQETKPSARDLVKTTSDLPRRTGRGRGRFRFPFE